MNTHVFHSPSTLEQALGYLHQDPGLIILAGGTDLWPQWATSGKKTNRLLSLHLINELASISLKGNHLHIGAMCTASMISQSPLVQEHCPALVQAAHALGTRAIQNRATIGGNVINASPAADFIPPLLAARADCELHAYLTHRVLPLDQCYVSYRQTQILPSELLTCIRVPILTQGTREQFRKLGTRRAQAISKVVGACRIAIDEQNTIQSIGLALGSVAPTPIRLKPLESWLIGQPIGPSTAKAAANQVSHLIQPIDDLRSTAEYRRAMAAQFVEDWILFKL